MKKEQDLQQSVEKRRRLVHQSFILNVDDPTVSAKRERVFLQLLERAQEKYDSISPVAERNSLEECVTRQGNRAYLWFNTPDGSTHIVTAPIEDREQS